ncbi:hypothetical protein [Streptomyces sp. NPDC008125]|uniref:hypothetical protein n=1 Tax=Streptomyces sp. NPDC008125 TaxID=3364811 RepID=UPI0036E5922A
MDGTVRPSAERRTERTGTTRVEYTQSSRPLAADVLARIQREPGMTRAALIQLIVSDDQ